MQQIVKDLEDFVLPEKNLEIKKTPEEQKKIYNKQLVQIDIY